MEAFAIVFLGKTDFAFFLCVCIARISPFEGLPTVYVLDFSLA